MMGLRLGLGLSRGGNSAPAPYAGFDIYYDYKNQVYAESGVAKASLAATTGYSFTDNVDNVPNVNASGYNSLTTELSTLSATSNPYQASDVDFIIWATVTFSNAPDAGQYDAAIQIGTASNIQLYRDNATGLLRVDATTIGGTLSSGVALGTSGRAVLLFRRKATINTIAVRSAGANTLASSGGTVWSALNSGLNVGHLGGSNRTRGFVEGVFSKTGTFTDAEINAILTAA